MSEHPVHEEGGETIADKRPRTVAEKEQFSCGGKRHRIFLRGKWGLAIDRGA